MTAGPSAGHGAVRGSDLARVFSPLLFFLAHVAYLVLWSPDPFLKKWIDGSFTFFVALVLCNLIRARVLRGADREGPGGEGPGAGGEER